MVPALPVELASLSSPFWCRKFGVMTSHSLMWPLLASLCLLTNRAQMWQLRADPQNSRGFSNIHSSGKHRDGGEKKPSPDNFPGELYILEEIRRWRHMCSSRRQSGWHADTHQLGARKYPVRVQTGGRCIYLMSGCKDFTPTRWIPVNLHI